MITLTIHQIPFPSSPSSLSGLEEAGFWVRGCWGRRGDRVLRNRGLGSGEIADGEAPLFSGVRLLCTSPEPRGPGSCSCRTGSDVIEEGSRSGSSSSRYDGLALLAVLAESQSEPSEINGDNENTVTTETSKSLQQDHYQVGMSLSSLLLINY